MQTLRQAVTKTHKELLYGTWSVDENILTVELQKETQQRISQQDHNQQRRRRGRNDTALMVRRLLSSCYNFVSSIIVLPTQLVLISLRSNDMNNYPDQIWWIYKYPTRCYLSICLNQDVFLFR